jgi:chromosome segregation ATPase
MREPTPRDSNGEGASMGVLGDAVWRLDQAVKTLEAGHSAAQAPDAALHERLAAQQTVLDKISAECEALRGEKAALTAELETAREREMALMDAAAAASDALGRAGAEVRAVLSQGSDNTEEEAA